MAAKVHQLDARLRTKIVNMAHQDHQIA